MKKAKIAHGEASPDTSSDKDASLEQTVAAGDTAQQRDTSPADSPEHTATTEAQAGRGNKSVGVRCRRMLSLAGRRPKVAVAAAVIVVLVAVGSVPLTRYTLLGFLLQRNYTVRVTDAVTHKPVTEATVLLDGKTVTTNANGDAKLKIHVGYRALHIRKAYYADLSRTILIPVGSKNSVSFMLHATGRQVPIVLLNTISGAPVGNALVQAGSAQARTDKSGKATIVLPVGKDTVSASITATGYNTLATKVQVTASTVPENTFKLTPAGKIYFLSKLSGTIDVVKTNLDGTDRQTVLAGTGDEDDGNTVLFVSPDWKYIALQSKRSAGGNPELNLIDTTNNDHVTNIDKGNAFFSPIGWLKDDFVYTVYRNDVPENQPKHASIKSFDAQKLSLSVIDNTNATAQDPRYGNADESYVFAYVFAGQLLYAKNWSSISLANMQGQQNTLVMVNGDGTDKRTIGHVNATDTRYVQVSLRNPQTAMLSTYQFINSIQSYNFIDEAGNLKPSNDQSVNDTFYEQQKGYFISPSTQLTAWTEERDGKNVLLVGNESGEDGKIIVSLDEAYTLYGWYTDGYLLVSKSGSELYILSATGGTPLKISDYHNPYHRYNGYGGY